MPSSTTKGVYANLENIMEFARDGIVSKSVLNAADKEESLFCMSIWQSLSSHTSSYPAIMRVLQSKREMTLAKKK